MPSKKYWWVNSGRIWNTFHKKPMIIVYAFLYYSIAKWFANTLKNSSTRMSNSRHIINSWHRNHQNIRDLRIFFTRFCLFVWSKIRMNHFLYWEGWVIPTFSKSWRHLKMYFPDSLKKIKKKIWLKRNIRKLRIFWWFRCHECINSLAASIHDLILQFFRSLWTYTRLYLGYS